MPPIPHDRLFKELLRNFFAEFLQLFLPRVAAYIKNDSIEFLDKEVFTDVDSGQRHEVDLLAKAKFRGHDAFFLIHTETQAARQPDFAGRMFRYFARLHEKHRLPVYPIALLSYNEPRRLEPDRFEISFPDKKVLDFAFSVIQLNRLNWREYMRHRNPVASALMSKMDIEPKDRPRVKLQCLRLLATLKLKPAKARLISGFVDQYLKLSAAEQRRYNREVKAMPATAKKDTWVFTTSWKEEGRKEGRKEGWKEGQVDLLVRQLQRRVGDIHPRLRSQLSSLPTSSLERFSEALLDFQSAADAEAWLKRHPAKRRAR
jgi:predicted transposase YdaD